MKYACESMAFSPDSRLLASTSASKIKLWELATGALRFTLEGHEDNVESGTFSPDGRLLVSASSDKIVKIWTPQPGPGEDISWLPSSPHAMLYSYLD